MNKSLNGKTVLITGGAQGIGWAVAIALAQEGAKVYACDISSENIAKAQAVASSQMNNAFITFTHCDVSDYQQVVNWVEQARDAEGQIDILINNAAFVQWDTVSNMSIEKAERIMQVGYHGMLYCTKLVLPIMLQNKRGTIINLGSAASKIFVGGTSAAYSATKAAIEAYTKTLQFELHDTKVNALLLRLGTVSGTDFFSKHVPSSQLPRFADLFPHLTPPQVAQHIVKILQSNKKLKTFDLPVYLPAIYFLYRLTPRLFYWLSTSFGSSKRDYGKVGWKH